jgi:hypothetical protein
MVLYLEAETVRASGSTPCVGHTDCAAIVDQISRGRTMVGRRGSSGRAAVAAEPVEATALTTTASRKRNQPAAVWATTVECLDHDDLSCYSGRVQHRRCK